MEVAGGGFEHGAVADRAAGQRVRGGLALFLVLARAADRGSGLGAVRRARKQAVREVLDDLRARQDKIENGQWRNDLARRGSYGALVLSDVTSSHPGGGNKAPGETGYNRDGKRGKVQAVPGVLAGATGGADRAPHQARSEGFRLASGAGPAVAAGLSRRQGDGGGAAA